MIARIDSIQRSGQHGFTLVELMITVAVFAVLLAIMVPSYSDMTLGSKLRSQANDLVAGAVLARSEAIKRNQLVTLCASSTGTSCVGSWAAGWIVITAGNVVLHKHAAAASGFQINAGTVTRLAFTPTGVGVTPTPTSAVPPFTLTVCRKTPSVGSQERVVSVSPTGRPSVTKTNTGSCS